MQVPIVNFHIMLDIDAVMSFSTLSFNVHNHFVARLKEVHISWYIGYVPRVCTLCPQFKIHEGQNVPYSRFLIGIN